MLSDAKIAAIKKDLAARKKSYEAVADSGIRKVIQDWILNTEKTLAGEERIKK